MASLSTQFILEGLVQGPSVAVSQVTFELLVEGSGLYASQITAEALVTGPGVYANQVGLEVLATGAGAHASQVVAEVLASGVGVRHSQIVLEILVLNHEVPMPAIYPTLKGLTYDIVKRPRWSTNVQKHVSGKEVRIGYYAYPQWEFELTYDFLPDVGASFAGTTASDFRTLEGFFLATYGALVPFLLYSEDESVAVGSPIAVADGFTTVFPVIRIVGMVPTDQHIAELVGYVSATDTIHVYLDGVLVDPADYIINRGQLAYQTLQFTSPPADGKVITADFTWYYAVRFQDDNIDFVQIARHIWDLKKVILQSVKN